MHIEKSALDGFPFYIIRMEWVEGEETLLTSLVLVRIMPVVLGMG